MRCCICELITGHRFANANSEWWLVLKDSFRPSISSARYFNTIQSSKTEWNYSFVKCTDVVQWSMYSIKWCPMSACRALKIRTSAFGNIDLTQAFMHQWTGNITHGVQPWQILVLTTNGRCQTNLASILRFHLLFISRYNDQWWHNQCIEMWLHNDCLNFPRWVKYSWLDAKHVMDILMKHITMFSGYVW
jgi:hypothetical protein